MPNGILINSTISISLWFKTSSHGGLIGHQTGGLPQANGQLVPILYIQPNGRLHARFWNGSVGNTNNNTTILNDDEWHHVVIIATPSMQAVYIDGVLTGQSTGMQVLTGMVSNQIGNVATNSQWTGTGGTGSFPFTGAIDDVRVYHSELNQANVTALFNEEFCFVNIPDANFKASLVGNTSINTNGNTEIECSEATTFTGIMDVNNQGISDLTGIEAFTALTELYCNSNQLTSLDVTMNTALTLLWCHNNQLSNLDVTSNTALFVLKCQENQMTNLDITSNTALVYFECNDNQLTSLDMQNGNNTAMNSNSLFLNNNPNLTCIKVDDPAYSTANWTNIDQGTYFSITCSTGIENLEESELSISPNPTTDYLNIDTDYIIEQYQLFSINGQQLLQGNTMNLDISTLAKGMYILQVQTNQGTAQRKIIKK